MLSFHVFAAHHLRLPHESSQRPLSLESFSFNDLRTVAPPSCAAALNNPLAINRLHTLSSSTRSTGPCNPFEMRQFRTLSRHNRGYGRAAFLFSPRTSNFQSLTPVFSHSCALFSCDPFVCHSYAFLRGRGEPVVFLPFLLMRLRTLYEKHPGVGEGAPC